MHHSDALKEGLKEALKGPLALSRNLKRIQAKTKNTTEAN